MTTLVLSSRLLAGDVPDLRLRLEVLKDTPHRKLFLTSPKGGKSLRGFSSLIVDLIEGMLEKFRFLHRNQSIFTQAQHNHYYFSLTRSLV